MSYTHGLRAALLASSAIAAAYASPAWAQSKDFDLPAQPASSGIATFAEQADIQILVMESDIRGRKTSPVRGSMTPAAGLQQLLAGTGLNVIAGDGRTFTVSAQHPQSGSAAGDGADGTVEALIVTAQKREEDIQDVPIAISAFSQEDLTRSQIAGGPDLMTQVPNMTFTKTNFTSYSIQIRGIGTQAISATTDPAVAVAFNNTPFVRNHFFEQEFYDLQRVEVLRGPQGTLYGRNATAGVVNVISAKPKFGYEAKVSGDLANYSSHRLEGMINIPLVEDMVALRLAGAWTRRDGFVTNALASEQTDGRDLWSGRISLAIEPNDWFRADLIYERFEENDDRLRSGKQLCRKDPGPAVIGSTPVPTGTDPLRVNQTYLSQGCLPTSLYSKDAFQTPNGYALPYYGPAASIGSPVFQGLDPYASEIQSRDLRTIETHIRPEYEAQADLVELQLRVELPRNLTLASETAYARDFIFSFQDFNRFDTVPGVFVPGPGPASDRRFDVIGEDGIFCDPQIGCTSRLAAADLATARSEQFSQELRLSSDYEGPFNFSLGANFLRYDTEDKYYVFINSLSAFAAKFSVEWHPGRTTNWECIAFSEGNFGWSDPNLVYSTGSGSSCFYMDKNDIHNLNDLGRNYFLSRNPYDLASYAAFGEAYYNIAPDLKLTAGFRWTVDKKIAPQIPSWLVASRSFGTPTRKVVEQEWREPTGRLAIDWKPGLSFTDETLVYGSYVHGYKAGGANPPPPIVVVYNTLNPDALLNKSLTHPETFEAEYIDAFELGAKNTLLDGRLTLNLGAFYYDYQGYQISQIVNRSSVNLNFDAEIWGAELEAAWRPLDNLNFGLKLGYENTRMADGSQAIDLMDRTAGKEGWVLMKPFPPAPSNCVMPEWFVEFILGSFAAGTCEGYLIGLDPLTNLPYVPNPEFRRDSNGNILSIASNPVVGGLNLTGYPGFDTSQANNGEGFFKDLSGNELPNAPHYTATFTADWTVPLVNEWLMTLRTDLYYQSEAWTRIFNTEGYDKLKAYTNANLAAIFTNEDQGWTVMAYVKNVMDRDSITGAFLNSDDTGLTTNVFLTEPRLYGLRVTKEWSDGSPLGGLLGASGSGGPPLLLVEAGINKGLLQEDSEALRPPGLTFFSPDGQETLLSPQRSGLDREDGEEFKLTYIPGRWNHWRVALGYRMVESEGGGETSVSELGPEVCFTVPWDPAPQCIEEGISIPGLTFVGEKEQFRLFDLTLGRVFGSDLLGSGGFSLISAGLRQADFNSRTAVEIVANTALFPPLFDAFDPEAGNFYQRDSITQANRSFEGTGPVLSWEASSRLLGDEDQGFDLDWSVTGGVLFGSQEVEISEDLLAGDQQGGLFEEPVLAYTRTINVSHRTEDVTVPHVGATLGVSYNLRSRVKVGAGYRWERYFDVIDGGYNEHKSYDRTIDGPYFKLSVGFGG